MTARDARHARLSAFALGLFTLVAQSALLREYLVLVRGSELALGSFLGAWFLSVAGAAAMAARWPALRRAASRHGTTLLAAYPLAALGGLALAAALRSLAGVAPWAPVPAWLLLSGGLLSTIPTGLATGLLFPSLCDRADADPARGAATAYAWEAAGALAGGLGAAALFLLGLDGTRALGAAGLVVAGVAALSAGARRRAWPMIVAILCVLVLAPGPGDGLRRALASVRLRANLAGAELVGERHVPEGLVTTAAVAGTTVVLWDGGVVLALPAGPDVAVDAALLAVQPARRSRALVLGAARLDLAGALAGAFGEVEVRVPGTGLRDGLASAWASAVGPLPAGLALEASDPRVRLGEARRGGERFDLVVMAGGEPRTLADNRLLSREALAEAAGVLAEGGVVALPLPAGENVMGPERRRFGASAWQTLAASVGPPVAVPGQEAWLLASPAAGRVTGDAEALAARVRSAGAPLPATAAAVADRARPDRAAWLAQRWGGLAGLDLVNTDARPLAPFLALLASLRLAGASGTAWLWGARQAGPWLGAGAVLLLLGLALRQVLRTGGRRGAVAAPLLVAVAGGAAMATGVVVMAAWQARLGALYGEIGLAGAATMAGLLAGAVLVRPLARRAGPGAAVSFCLAGAATLAVLPWTLSLLDGLEPAASRAVLALMMALAGALAGAGWPLAAGQMTGPATAQRLQAADHLGAALGAAVPGVAGLAVLGSATTLWTLAGALAAVAAVVAFEGLVAGRGRALLAGPRGAVLGPDRFPWPAWAMVGTALFLSAWGVATVARPEGEGPLVRLSPEQVRALDPADQDEVREGPFAHHRLAGVREPAGDAVAFASGAAAPGAPGWGGPLDLALSVGADGTVRRVQVLRHRETPAYVRDLPAWLARFEGRPVSELAALGDPRGVDALTGATVTARAATRTVADAARAVGRDLLALPVPDPAPPRPWHDVVLDPRLVYAVLVLAGALWVHRRGSARVRLAFLAASLVAGGLWLDLQLSAGWLLSCLRLEPPSFAADPALALLGAGALVLAVVQGPLWCAHACPLGAAQELASVAGERWGLRVRWDPRLQSAFRLGKSALLVVVALLLFVPDGATRLGWDPLANAFAADRGWAERAVVAVAVAGSLFTFRFWCRGFCPVGAFLSLANRVPAWLGWLPARRYGACDMGVRGPADGDCLQCNRCVRGTGIPARAPREEAP